MKIHFNSIFKKENFFFIFIGLILTPILLYPIGGDQCIYITAGKLICEGKIIYSDFVDLKQPLFFYFFAIIYKIFGNGEFQIRLFDYIWQLTTIALLYKLTFKEFGNLHLSRFISFCYTFSYSCLSYSQTLHPESFTSLFILLILWQLLFKNKFSTLIIGLMIGLCVSFKITYIFLLPIPLWLIFNNPQLNMGRKIFNSSLILAFFILPNLISIVILNYQSNLNDYLLVFSFTKYYSNLATLNHHFLLSSYKSIIYVIAEKYSMIFTFSFFIGLYYFNKENKIESLKIILYLFFALFISYLIERKFHYYQFSRMFPLLSILAGAGLFHLKSLYNSKFISNKIVLSFIIICIVFFSNLIRYSNQLVPSINYFFDKKAYNLFYTNVNEGTMRNDFIEVANYLKSKGYSKDNYKSYGTISLLVNYFASDDNYSKFPQALFFLSNYKINKWEKDVINEMNNSKYLVIQTHDMNPVISGYIETTYERMRGNNNINSILSSNFDTDTVFKNFIVYKKRY